MTWDLIWDLFVDVVWPVAMAFFGGCLLYVGTRDFCLALKSNKWPTTKGKILERWMYTSITARGFPIKKNIVIYEYEVDGIKHYSRTIYFGDRWIAAGNTNAERILRRYQPNRFYPVYYDRDKPERAVLKPGLQPNLLIIFPVALAAGVIGFLLAYHLTLPYLQRSLEYLI